MSEPDNNNLFPSEVADAEGTVGDNKTDAEDIYYFIIMAMKKKQEELHKDNNHHSFVDLFRSMLR